LNPFDKIDLGNEIIVNLPELKIELENCRENKTIFTKVDADEWGKISRIVEILANSTKNGKFPFNICFTLTH